MNPIEQKTAADDDHRFDLLVDGEGSIPIAGTGLFYVTLSLFLIFGGALGELIIRTGVSQAPKFSLLTANEIQHEHLNELKPINEKSLKK